jgi:iron complex outermembrane receptor protein
VRLTDRLSFLIGGRYDNARDASSAIYGTTTSVCFPTCDGHLVNQPTEKQLSPAAGMSFRVAKDMSLFGSYSRSFAGSNTAITFNGLVPAPQKGRQYEAGAKASLLNGRIFATTTLFLLYQYNLAEADPAHPGYSNLIGEARSEGAEFDLTGRVSRHVSVVSNYTYDDAAVSAANGISRVVGRRLGSVPRHAANLWVRYDTAPGSPRGWMFGLGAYISGDRFSESANTVLLPAYERFDAMAGYRTISKNVSWTAQLNAGNVFDKTYFLYGNPFTYGAPRSVIFSLKAQIAPRR